MDRFPSIFPRGEIIVEEEKFLETNELQGGVESPKLVYQLDKAPIEYIRTVEATVNKQSTELEEGVDFELGANKETINFGIGGDNPDNNTQFTVVYVAQSIISRYIGEHDRVLDDTEETIEEVVGTKYIGPVDEDADFEAVSGQELDQIGRIFGLLGRRSGRDDPQYRSYLKSIVQSFSGRGTLDGVKFAVSSGLGPSVPEEEIEIVEDFENNSYEIEIENFGDLEGIDLATVNELAELADPSGVKLELINFGFEPVTSSLVGDDVLAEQTIEEVRVAHANDGDRVQIDVNSLLSADFAEFTEADEIVIAEDQHYRTDEVLAASWNTGGTIQIDVSRDGNTEVSSANKLEEEQDSEQVTAETTFETVEEIETALASVGRGNIDHADDGSSVDWEPEDTDTQTSTFASDDEQAQRLDEVQPAYYESGPYQIDVYELLTSDLDQLVTSEAVTDDTQFQETSEVLAASAGFGRGQIDVAFDPNTTVIGDDPESFLSTDSFVTDDEQAQRLDQLSVAHYDSGLFEIDLLNLKNSSLDRFRASEQLGDDTQFQELSEVLVASAGHGRGQIDVAYDGSTTVIGDDPESFTSSESSASDDFNRYRTDEVLVASYDNGVEQVHVYYDPNTSISGESPVLFTSTDENASDDSVNQTVEQVQTAFAQEGKASIDANSLTEEAVNQLFTEEQVQSDETNQATTEVLVASYNYGVNQVHVSYDGNTASTGVASFDDDWTSRGVSDDTESQTVEEVTAAYANEGHANIDTAQ